MHAEEELKAGPELDALVGEKVMGWDPKPYRFLMKLRRENEKPNQSLDTQNLIRLSAEVETMREFKMEHSLDLYPKYYSGTMNCAWLVVEKMEEEKLFINLNSESNRFDVIFSTIYISNKRFWAKADTAPLAICRAALKAVG